LVLVRPMVLVQMEATLHLLQHHHPQLSHQQVVVLVERRLLVVLVDLVVVVDHKQVIHMQVDQHQQYQLLLHGLVLQLKVMQVVLARTYQGYGKVEVAAVVPVLLVKMLDQHIRQVLVE